MVNKIIAFSIASLIGTQSFFILLPIDTTHAADTNLIINPSLEDVDTSGLPIAWLKGRWGTNTSIFSFPVAGASGGKAAKVEITAYTNGDAKWYFQEIPVVSGKEYTFSHSYRSSVVTYVTVQYRMSNGTLAYQDIVSLNASPSWSFTQSTFTVPAGVNSLCIFHVIKSVGTLSIDDYTLSEVQPPPPPTPGNLVPNPSLETAGAAGLPASWLKGRWGTNTSIFSYPISGTVGKAAEVRITSYTSGDAKWYFSPISIIGGGHYIFSDSYKTNAKSYATAQYQLSNGTYLYQDLGSLNSSNNSWTNMEVVFQAPANAVNLTIFHLIKSIGTLAVDEYALRTTSQRGWVSLNFDDGWLDMYNNAIPMLNAASLKSTQYIVTGRLGSGFTSNVKPAQVLAMQAAGHEIGAHTRTHSDLTALSPIQIQDEIFGSRTDLLGIGVQSVSTFAFPFGAYNASIQATVQRAGFIGARATNRGYNTSSTNRYALNRQAVDQTITFQQVQQWITTATNSNTWLILVFHHIDSSGGAYTTSPALLQQIVDYLKTNNIEVLTNQQSIQRLFP